MVWLRVVPLGCKFEHRNSANRVQSTWNIISTSYVFGFAAESCVALRPERNISIFLFFANWTLKRTKY